jgi:predicted Fe-Mo cluster-binding NifX family protein
MKIAVSTDNNSMDANISSKFTTSPFFAIIDEKTLECKFVSNEGIQGARSSAGMKAVRQLNEEGVNLILTGNMKANLYTTFRQVGIQVYMNVTGTLADIIKELK